MKPQKDNNTVLIMILVVSIMILIGLVVGGTFAFYTSNFTDNKTGNDGDNSSFTAGNIEYSLVDGTLTGENLIPGDSIVKTFQVTNKGTGPITFKLFWNSVTNTFVNQKDLIVTLEADGTAIISESDNITLPGTITNSQILKDNLIINAGETKNYILTITYKNTDEDQSDDMGKSIKAVIGLGE